MLIESGLHKFIFSNNEDGFEDMLKWVMEKVPSNDIKISDDGIVQVYMHTVFANAFIRHFSLCCKEGLVEFEAKITEKE